ncbi:GumC domain-containing protein [Flavobacterium algicola]|uniref:lipopolysaccharide biosynthesis protein n=1 Tax=Flavobacterium algicola TaxID=556529 RepID=UPI001EFC62BB|nr:lipopolysaccharide biosynthesis protein [Flavobacterium algicola]MCG9793934.1 lipopolysaccharide biosynthesis protein [Flavobacterium algicola]
MEDQVNSDEISLKDLLLQGKDWYDFLISKWKVVILVSLIGGTVGLGYAFMQKPNYIASLSFALEEDGGGGGGGVLSLASQFGFDLGTSGGGAFSGSNLIELFRSRKMIETTLLSPIEYKNKQMSLADMYLEVNEINEDWSEVPKLKNINFSPEIDRKHFSRVQDSILGKIYGNIATGNLIVGQKDKKIDIISIDVSSKNELFSKYFCEALAREVSEFYVQTKNKKARENLGILQHQTDSVRAALNSAITGVAVANDNTFNLNPALNVRRTPSARRQVDVQANTAILTEIVKQLELAKVTFRKATPLIQVIDKPILPLEKKGFGKLKGIVLFSFLSGFLCICYLVGQRILKSILQ